MLVDLLMSERFTIITEEEAFGPRPDLIRGCPSVSGHCGSIDLQALTCGLHVPLSRSSQSLYGILINMCRAVAFFSEHEGIQVYWKLAKFDFDTCQD